MADDNRGPQSERDDVDTGLAALVAMLVYLQRPADYGQLRHALGHGDPSTLEELSRLAKRDGVRSRVTQIDFEKLQSAPLPAIAETGDGFIVVGKAGPDGVLVQEPANGQVSQWSAAQFLERSTGRYLLLTTRESVAGLSRKFDISWFIPALVRYRRLLGEVLLASLFIQILGLISPIFFQVVIDKVLVHKSLTTLEVLAIGMVGLFLFETLLSGLRQYLFAHTTSRVDVELGANLFRHLQSLPMAYFGSRRVGDTVARVRELETIRSFLTSNAVTLVLDLLFTIVFLGVMYLYSPKLLLIVLISIPIYIGISLAVLPGLRSRIDEKFKRHAENQSFLVESVTGIETLKSMAVEPQMQNRWERQLAGYVGSGFSAAMLGNWGSQAIQLVSKLTTVAILYFGAKAVINGEMTVGMLVAFNMLAGRVSQPVLRLAQLAQDFQQARLAVDRLGDILNAPAEPAAPSRSSLPAIKGQIRLDKVRFRYRVSGPEVLRGIDLDVAPGEMLGIVGPSGSGKSTLTKLIQRLHVPEQGRVLVDGVDLALIDPTWLRRQVGVVLQENMLFNRTVRENIALANPAWPMDRVMAAATLAGAHEFILELPEGYDTRIDERGANLSGGQRQRIAIARALIGNPKILILDEATSALDAESEEVVQRNLRRIAEGRTVVIIAHRLSAVRQCNRIISIEEGQITEMGSHSELLIRGGRYAQMYNRQMGIAERGAA
ncbi:MAG: type I secretion system permease/ATPase [Sphingomonas sanxanigenens]|uniref:Type I secretion system permease/ATPase n=1 Tax=Sphingomonas sanxanigenens TaxID=397260 RepID=A0A2W5ABX0_9SPHN|nr:MAG: type I secretion system permease/ATPase [Sphingomonas sanxanigenens]